MCASVQATGYVSVLPFEQVGDKVGEFMREILNGEVRDEAVFLKKIKEIYPEVNYYKGEVSGSPDGVKLPGDEAEQKRTELSLLCFLWIMNNDYARFTECQAGDSNKLSPESFDKLSISAREKFSDPRALDAMFTTMAIHDLGKIKWFKDEVIKFSGQVSEDHDEVLLHGLQYCPRLLPSYSRLSVTFQKTIKTGWEMRFSVGQFTQAENLPANLKKVLELRDIDPQSADFFFFHEILDVAGVLGHVKSNGSAILNELTLFAYNGAWCAISDIGLKSEEDIYNSYLKLRGDRLGLNFEIPLEKACIRLCCMSRMYNKDDGALMKSCLESYPESRVRENLIEELLNSGLDGKPGILIYYAPQLMVNLIKAKVADKEAAISIGISILSEIFRQARVMLEPSTDMNVLIIDVSELCKRALDVEFKPECLLPEHIVIDVINKIAKSRL